jgi:hypothetical protein
LADEENSPDKKRGTRKRAHQNFYPFLTSRSKMIISSLKVDFKANARERRFNPARGSRRQRDRRVQKLIFNAAITATHSDRANPPNRTRNNRQDRRTDPDTQSEFSASVTLNTPNDFDDGKFKIELDIALAEIDQEDDAVPQQFDAKFKFEYHRHDREDSNFHDASEAELPPEENASSSRTAPIPAASNRRPTSSSGPQPQHAQSQDAQSQDVALVNDCDSTNPSTEANTNVNVVDNNDDIESYEDFIARLTGASDLEQKDGVHSSVQDLKRSNE